MKHSRLNRMAKTARRRSDRKPTKRVAAEFSAPNPILQLQAKLGNQAVAHYLHSQIVQTKPDIVRSGDKYQYGTKPIAERMLHVSIPISYPAFNTVPIIQKEEATSEQRSEFERDREHFAQAQDEFFAQMGEDIRNHILREVGFQQGYQPANADEALRVIQLWGLSIDALVQRLPQLGRSLSTRVHGSTENTTLAQHSQQLIAAMNRQGRQTFNAMLSAVRAEPFWANWLDHHSIFIFPDLSGANRYGGYTQRSDDRWNPAFIIHISKDTLEAGQTAAATATLIHELSHTTTESTTSRAMQPFLQRLALLLADHRKVKALRTGASNAQEARTIHMNRIRQILYERTAYAEEEIFVHLQQLTHQPSVSTTGGTIQPHRYILARVEAYVAQLRRIRLPERTLRGILDSLGRRVGLLYDRRIRALPRNSRERRLMELSKDQALLILRIARS